MDNTRMQIEIILKQYNQVLMKIEEDRKVREREIQEAYEKMIRHIKRYNVSYWFYKLRIYIREIIEGVRSHEKDSKASRANSITK